MKNYRVGTIILQKSIDYLAGFPYRDVFQLIHALQQNVKPEDDTKQNLIVNEELILALRAFLIKQPFDQVVQLISDLNTASIVVEKAPEPIDASKQSSN